MTVAPARPKAAGSKMRVLLVEDTLQHAKLVLKLLARGDLYADVTHVETLAAACDTLDQQEIDLVLLDLGLPDSSLQDTLPAFRRQHPGVPVIVLTALEDMDVAILSVESGAQDYLVKMELGTATLERSIRYSMSRHEAMEKLRVANENLNRFAGHLCHEIRNPLNTVALAGELLEVSAKSEEEVETVSFLQAAAQDIKETVEQLHSLGTGKSVRLQPVDPNQVVASVQQALARDLEDSGATIRADDLPSVTADPVGIRHVVQNLVGNSIKYRSEEPLIIEIDSTQVDDRFQITIRDNGRGIPEGHRDAVFEIFHRLERDRELKGSGIGMALCRQVIERSRGRIWISDTDVGCAVTFELQQPDPSEEGLELAEVAESAQAADAEAGLSG